MDATTDLTREPDHAVYKTLLESTKAIPWRIDWDTKRFTYIGPQIQDLLGWTPDSWTSVEDWAARMHDEDREYVVNFCVMQSQNGIDHEADYRALTADGGYVWIRDVVHVVRKDNGDVDSLVGFMFDISQRKRDEQELERLRRELEVLSFKDGLTGVANRRMFNMTLDREWASARREARPLSVILLDIDYFKQYNDHFGHLAGDECLKQVAKILQETVSRPRDLVARYGGEEFVLVLPETDAVAAHAVAERVRQAIVDAQMPHARRGDILTVSQGVGTIVPDEPNDVSAFIHDIDRRLYRAKQEGRNRVVG